MNKKELYAMSLHTGQWLGSHLYVHRVVKGWLYFLADDEKKFIQMTFVME